jgi:hypothetical protein
MSFDTFSWLPWQINPSVISISAGDWLVVIAELLVAGVIYMELEHSRDTAFFEKATNKAADEDRRKIYAAFLEERGTNDERQRKFYDKLVKRDPGGATLRECCHSQLAMFNEMGFEIERWLSIQRFRGKKNKLISIFPHAPIFFWFIVGPYVCERRKLTGPWFGHNALIFIKRSIEYVLIYSKQLTLNLPGEDQPVIISNEELKNILEKLDELIADNKPLKRST